MTGNIIDVHCHLFAFNHKDGFVNTQFIRSLRMDSYLKGIGVDPYDLNDPYLYNTERLNEEYRNTMLRHIEESALSHVVVLPFDGVYDLAGKLDKAHTSLYVSNDAVWELHRLSPDKIIPAASINPVRADWREELDKCVKRGIKIMKWLPSVMSFSPDGGAYFPSKRQEEYSSHINEFYDLTRDAGITILTHVGFEFALPVLMGSYARLERLGLPLSKNVSLCAAHLAGGTPYLNNRRQFRLMKEMARMRANLYFDTAGMSSPHRKARLEASLADKTIRPRIVYGSDYPIRVRSGPFLTELRAAGLLEEFRDTTNPFDRDILIKRAMGMADEDFKRGYEMIDMGGGSNDQR